MPDRDQSRTITRSRSQREYTINPSSDGQTSQSRRLVEPLDESGGPLIPDRQDKGQEKGQEKGETLQDLIRLRAYERYLTRQGRPGSPEQDWLEAEREVRSSSYRVGDRRTPQARA